MKQNVFFVSGIDTNIGKSYATAYLARLWNEQGRHTITQKFIQTGNPEGYSEDIELHRRLMGMNYLPEDEQGITKPEIFTYPASPDLASRIDGRAIDFDKIKRATKVLSERYDAVLVEGAGGLMVPLSADYLTIDYIQESGYPLIFVTSGRLGSINHTLLSFEAIERWGIKLHTVMYNMFPEGEDKIIQADTEAYIRCYMEKHFPGAAFVKVPCL